MISKDLKRWNSSSTTCCFKVRVGAKVPLVPRPAVASAGKLCLEQLHPWRNGGTGWPVRMVVIPVISVMITLQCLMFQLPRQILSNSVNHEITWMIATMLGYHVGQSYSGWWDAMRCLLYCYPMLDPKQKKNGWWWATRFQALLQHQIPYQQWNPVEKKRKGCKAAGCLVSQKAVQDFYVEVPDDRQLFDSAFSLVNLFQ